MYIRLSTQNYVNTGKPTCDFEIDLSLIRTLLVTKKLKFIHKQRLKKKKKKKRDPLEHWKNGWIQTPQRILMDPCIKQAPVLSKRFWFIPWPLAYNRLNCIRKIINFWYTFGWKWGVFVTIWDCRTHFRMTSMTSSVERTDLDFKISVALLVTVHFWFLNLSYNRRRNTADMEKKKKKKKKKNGLNLFWPVYIWGPLDSAEPSFGISTSLWRSLDTNVQRSHFSEETFHKT